MNARNPIMNGPTNTYPDTLGLSSHWPNVLFLFGEVFSLLIFPLLLPLSITSARLPPDAGWDPGALLLQFVITVLLQKSYFSSYFAASLRIF